jgi:hypothetical protein
MQTNNITFTTRNHTAEKSRIHLLQAVALIIVVLIGFNFAAHAKTYSVNLNGIYNDPAIWTPGYPGNIIQETDTVVINNDITLNTDIVIKGTVLIRRTGSFMGNKKIVILPSGKLINFGTSVVDAINNRGMIYNKHILEIALDLINSGEVINQENMVIGNITDNIGLITGQGGNLISNKRLVNSQTGVIRGNLDVCSNNFMNVDGGTIDSTHLSFCGHRIFRSIYLSADIRKENVVLCVKNSVSKDYKNYQVERSVDGINYETIATVDTKDIKDLTLPFQYLDNEVVKSNSVFYRVKVTSADNLETFIPAVEVGNILTTNQSDKVK